MIERQRFEAPRLVDDPGGDLDVRAWRFSYNARGIVEMPNRLAAKDTAVIMVHPWAIDDEWGWKSPQPNGVADFCTPEKNALASKHTEVITPFLNRLRGQAAFVMYSLPDRANPIRPRLARVVPGSGNPWYRMRWPGGPAASRSGRPSCGRWQPPTGGGQARVRSATSPGPT